VRGQSIILKASLVALVLVGGFTLRAAWEFMPRVGAQGNCTEVQTFEGQGNLQTPPFDITGDTWQITYTLSNLEEGVEGGLFITVYDSNGEFITSASQEVAGTNTTTVNAGAGTYYLDISSVLGNWTVTVEDCGAGGAPPIEESPAEEPPLLEAGGPSTGPVPPMPSGGCPVEFPVQREGACYSTR
jgi:hypothetical protein